MFYCFKNEYFTGSYWRDKEDMSYLSSEGDWAALQDDSSKKY